MAKNTRTKNPQFIYYPVPNKYYGRYTEIIERAKARGVPSRWYLKKLYSPGTYEYHHIIPECLGGPNTLDNQVILTPREHIICHHLLCYMFEQGTPASNKCWYAYKRAINRLKFSGHGVTARKYEIIKRTCASRMAAEIKGIKRKPKTQKQKDHISRVMTGRKRTPEHIENHRKSILGKPCHPNTLSRACRVIYEVQFPDGTTETFANLKHWCLCHPNMNKYGILAYFAKTLSHYKGHQFRKL